MSVESKWGLQVRDAPDAELLTIAEDYDFFGQAAMDAISWTSECLKDGLALKDLTLVIIEPSGTKREFFPHLHCLNFNCNKSFHILDYASQDEHYRKVHLKDKGALDA